MKRRFTKTFLALLALFLTTAFLLLTMDFLFRYSSLTREAQPLHVWRTAAFFWLLLAPPVLALAALFTLLCRLLKRLEKAEAYLKVALKIACTSFIATTYILYGKEGFARNLVLGNWLFAIPALVVAGTILLYVKQTERFNQGLRNIVRICLIPGGLFFLVSLVWVAPWNINMRALWPRQEELPERIEFSGTPLPKEDQGPSIIFVTFDALSAADMSLYGYDRDTTPFWKELAEESYTFDRMHANCTYTEPSIISILTSKYPWTHGIYRKGALSPKQAKESLPALLKEYGYVTVAVLGPLTGSLTANPEYLGLEEQFDHIRIAPAKAPAFAELFIPKIKALAEPIKRNVVNLWLRGVYFDVQYSALGRTLSWQEPELKETVEGNLGEALAMLRSVSDRPLFIWVHIMPPHMPYRPPPPFHGTYLPRSIELDIRQFAIPYFHTIRDFRQKLEYANKVRARYDEMVLYTDAKLREFIHGLKKLGRYKDSILILSADHGEVFDKGLCATHGSPHLYEPEVHIPLLVHTPGQEEPRRVHALAQSLDIAPTILDLLGKPIPGWMEGESLVPYMRGDSAETDRPKFAMMLEGNQIGKPIRAGAVAVYYGDYKMVWTREWARMDKEKERLHLIAKDPRERRNLLDQEPETASRLRGLIKEGLAVPERRIQAAEKRGGPHEEPIASAAAGKAAESAPAPRVEVEGYRDYNIIAFDGKFYGLLRTEGEFDYDLVKQNKYRQCFVGDTVQEVRLLINDALKRRFDKR